MCGAYDFKLIRRVRSFRADKFASVLAQNIFEMTRAFFPALKESCCI